MNKKIILVIIIVIVLSFIVYRLFIKEEKPAFTLEKIARGQVIKEVFETGTVKVSEKTDLSFKNSGRIEKIYVKAGDNVTTGQNLAKLDTSYLAIQLAEAQADLKVAQAKKTDAQVSLESAQQELQDIINKAEEDLNNAQEDAVAILENAYLKVYNAYNTAYNIHKNYFSIPDVDGLKVLSARDRIELYSEQIEEIIDEIEGGADNFGSALSTAEEKLQNTGDSLKEIRDVTEIAAYRTIVSSTDKTAIDTHSQNINNVLEEVIDAKQAISTIKVDKEADINDAQATISALENQLKENEESPGLYQSQIKQVQAQISLLQNQIQESTLKSPTDGQIIEINKREGEVVQSTDAVISFLPSAPFQIEVDIYEEDIIDVKVGNPVNINLVAFPDLILKGRVVSIDPAEKLIEQVVYYEVTIDFEETKEGIRPGMTADITIETAKKENMLIISKGAVKKINGKKIVQVFKKGEIEEREIETGLEGDEFFEIISGLEEGNEVVVE
jgi:HlyD family secretion protein